MNKVTEDAAKEEQKRQEEEAAAMAQQAPMSPEQAMAPAAMQAMAGAQAPQSPIPGATPGMESLGQLLGALRAPAMTVSPMRGVERGAV